MSDNAATKKSVYFIQAGARGPIKIGYATDVKKRMSQIQTGCPHQLFLLRATEHDDAPKRESELHEQFASLRINRSEWFRWSPAILEEIGMSRRESEHEVQRFIEAARELLKPTPVKLGHIPGWFKVAMRPLRKRFDGRLAPMWDTLQRLSTHPNRWLDHWGSTNITVANVEYVAFCSEPYSFTSADANTLDDMSARTGVRWQLDPNSWHYPGHTHRILILPPEQQDDPKQTATAEDEDLDDAAP